MTAREGDATLPPGTSTLPAMPDLEQAFPDRPLRLRGAGNAPRAWLLLLGSLVLSGALVFMSWDSAQAIRTDLTLRDTARPSAAAHILRGSCSSRLFLLQSCDLELSVRGKSEGEHRRSVSYIFVEPHMGNWNSVALLDPAQPSLPTTQLGQDRLINRMVTTGGILLFVPLFLLGGVSTLREHWQAERRVAAMSEQRLVPVPVRLDRISAGPQWWITAPGGPSSAWPMGRGDQPLFLDRERGIILALRGAAGGEAFPLDAKLRRVRLSGGERGRALAVLPGQK